VKIRGIESQGMILSASLEDDSDLEVLTINKEFHLGKQQLINNRGVKFVF
jgi:tRNA-binding EMAP/Myf-like protein